MRTSIIILFILITCNINAQDMKPCTLNGYVTNMQSAIFEEFDENWISDNLIHNRLNFKWYMSDKFTFDLELRNRFMSGQSINNSFIDELDEDNGIVDLSTNISSGEDYVLNSKIDRLWFQYISGGLEITVGRQRVNWGRSFAWNPNDVFNSYSFFDFDYEEKPGSDALRAQYYWGFASSFDFAIASDNDENITAAGRLIFNKWNYDFQFLGGIVKSDDYIIGAGWEGAIKDAGFRGEISYLHPIEEFSDTSGVVLACAGIDYTFSNSLMLRLEAFYNQYIAKSGSINLYGFLNSELSVKTLSFSEWSFMGSVSYPITPLLNSTLNVMYFPEMKGFFVGPSLEYSFTDNLYFSIIYQVFSGEFVTSKRDKFNMAYLRLKYSF